MTRKSNILLFVVAVAVVATIAAALNHRAAARESTSNQSADGGAAPTAVPTSVMVDLSAIPPAVWDSVGTTGASRPVFVGTVDTAGGKPVFLYIGSLYCPYCAAARWPVIAALARFGSFTGLTYSASSSADVYPSTPTFSFHGGSYASPYLVLQSVELESDVQLANGHYAPLETPSDAQQQLLQQYDAPPYVPSANMGGIPFILIGGRYMWGGSPYSPELLSNQTQAGIAATLPNASGSAARAILTSANEMTAAICAVDGNQPKDVCGSKAVREAIKGLPAKAP
ncbi:MAG TPA: DUF929 family protein [Gemmatimonadaceae bacterium]|nr:DUF929 family protein [Gemmatimonadaceae bacterium]